MLCVFNRDPLTVLDLEYDIRVCHEVAHLCIVMGNTDAARRDFLDNERHHHLAVQLDFNVFAYWYVSYAIAAVCF